MLSMLSSTSATVATARIAKAIAAGFVRRIFVGSMTRYPQVYSR